MIQQVLDLMQRRAIFLGAIALLLTILALTVTVFYPVSFKLSRCEIRDNSYVLHRTTYQLRTVLEQSHGASVKLCIREVTQTKQNNLVEDLK